MLRHAEVNLLTLGKFSGFDDYRDNVRSIAKRVGFPDESEAILADFDAQLRRYRRLDGSPDPRAAPSQILSWTDRGRRRRRYDFRRCLRDAWSN